MFGVPVDDLTMTETLQLVEALVEHGRRHGTNHQLATVNVDFLVNALADERTMQILQFADACIPDGMPVVWGCRALGMPLRERVAGADLVPLLIEQSRRTGWHVHVFGSTPEVARAATALLEQRYPGSRFSIDPGPMIPDVDQVDDATLEAIMAVDADILCVALGNPKQERFIQAHRDRLRVPVMIGVGGSLDMLVGKRRRAPAWVQRIGMEWVVRAAQEPHRLGRRYAHDIRVFGPTFVRHWRENRSRSRQPGLQLVTTAHSVTATIGGATVPDHDQWAAAARRVLAGGSLVIDGTDTTMRDEAAAQLVGLARLARRSGAPVEQRAEAGIAAACAALGITPAMIGLDR
jgi:N-acetylglucosaminyldiphosphoundecaprenol N-acetyl-beta-D-mannosaminyltransferase